MELEISNTENTDKINASDFIKLYTVPNDDNFNNYIKAIYDVSNIIKMLLRI